MGGGALLPPPKITMATKQMELLSQYFAGEQLEQITSLISMMRSQDKINYEIGLMYMKELKLYPTFIKMLHNYYGGYIDKYIFANDGGVLFSQNEDGYFEFLVEFSFLTRRLDVLCVGGGVCLRLEYSSIMMTSALIITIVVFGYKHQEKCFYLCF